MVLSKTDEMTLRFYDHFDQISSQKFHHSAIKQLFPPEVVRTTYDLNNETVETEVKIMTPSNSSDFLPIVKKK